MKDFLNLVVGLFIIFILILSTISSFLVTVELAYEIYKTILENKESLKDFIIIYQEIILSLEGGVSFFKTKILLFLLLLIYICDCLSNNTNKNNHIFGILYYYPHKESTHSILLRFSGVILILIFFLYVFLFSSISFYGDKGILFFLFFLGVSLNTIFFLLHLYFIMLHYKESKDLLEYLREVEKKYLVIKDFFFIFFYFFLL